MESSSLWEYSMVRKRDSSILLTHKDWNFDAYGDKLRYKRENDHDYFIKRSNKYKVIKKSCKKFNCPPNYDCSGCAQDIRESIRAYEKFARYIPANTKEVKKHFWKRQWEQILE